MKLEIVYSNVLDVKILLILTETVGIKIRHMTIEKTM
jgi:hypothetical protein